MPRSYFRTLPDLYERKAFGTDTHPAYPPSAVACFVGVLCFAEQQPERGRFKSRRVLVALLEGPHGKGRSIAKQLGYLIEHGDLVEKADGTLYVEGWDELQEGNWQVAERMERYRDRRKAVTVPVTVEHQSDTAPVTDDPSRVVAESGRQRAVDTGRETAPDDEPEWSVLSYLASVKAVIQPNGNGYHRELIALVERQGPVKVIAAMKARYAAGDRSPRQLLYGASNDLEPITRPAPVKEKGGHQASKEEAERAFSR